MAHLAYDAVNPAASHVREDGADVVRILDAVEDDEQRGRPGNAERAWAP